MRWVYVAAGLLGLYILLGKKSVVSAPIMEENPDIPILLKNANPASLPIVTTLNADELRVMQYAEIMISEGQRQGIPPHIIAAIIRKESSGIPTAIRYESNVKDSSYGLMQVLSSTARDLKNNYTWLKYNGNPQTLFDPSVNIEIGTAYLMKQYHRYSKNPVINPITDMIAAYNAGSVFVNELTYTNSVGNPKVQVYVDLVMQYKLRFWMMFTYLYRDYGWYN